MSELSSRSDLDFSAVSAHGKSTQLHDSDRSILLETLIDLAPDAIFVANAHGTFIEVNACACEMLGYSQEELLRKGIADILAPEELPRLKSLEERLVQGFTQTEIWTHLHRDGSVIPAEVSFKVLPNDYRVAYLRDLRDRLKIEGDRQRALVELQAGEERLQLALQGAGLGIWDWDLESQVLTWDDRCKEIFGLPPGFPVTYEWHVNALHPDDRQRVADAATLALRDRTEFDQEYRTFHPDGTMRWVLARGRGVYDPTGTLYRMSGTVLDITDRKQAELALRGKEQQLQQLSDAMPQFVWMCKAQGELDYVNQRWLDYTGLTSEESFDSAQLAATIHSDDLQFVANQWAQALEIKQPFQYELRIKRAADGEYRWFLARTVPFLNEQGQVQRWYGTSTDIHDRKLAELNHQFLTDLDLRLRQLSDVDAMAWETVCRIGEYLKVDRCLWHTVDLQAGTTIVQQDWHLADLESVKGAYWLSEYILPPMINHYQTGQPLVINDVVTHSYTAIPAIADNFAQHKIRAILGIPWIESGRWVATFAVNSRHVRQWQAHEVELLQAVVTRLWSIIEQTRAMQALREQEERTRLATEAARLGMWFWDIPKDELVWTDRCKALFGFAPEMQISYEMFLNVLHPDDRDRTQTAVTRALEQKVEYDTEYRAIWPDGSIHWIAAKGRAFYAADGRAVRMMGTVQDISDRKQADIELQERSEHIRLLYETTRDLLSTEHPLELVDSLFAKLKSLIGLDVYFNFLLNEERQLLHLRFYGGISEATAQSIEWLEVGRAVCGTVAEGQCQIMQPDVQNTTDPKTDLIRSLGLTAYCCQPLIAQGKLFGTLSFGSRSRTTFTPAETNLFQAICDQIAIALERSELLLSLQQQTEELRTVNRLKDDFFSALSHELRTPLNPILGWTRLLQGQKLTPEKVTQALDTIDRNVRQQISLVDDLLDVSRVIQGKMRLDSHPVNLVMTLTAAMQSVEFSAQAKGIALHFTHPNAVYTEGDGNRLQQVFWNILSNAIKFTPNGGKVDVELSVTNDSAKHCAQVRITDTGIGISFEFLPHVFEYFRQAEGGTKRNYGGLGLGLAIVRHLVELHGGTVIAESPGLRQGTTFTVKLPLIGTSPAERKPSTRSNFTHSQENPVVSVKQDAQALAVPPPPVTPSPISPGTRSSGSLSGVRILLVDDEPDNLELLKVILGEEGAILTAFTSPANALQSLSQSPPDLVISDIGMPQMNGYEFIQAIRSLPPEQGGQVKAIAITAYAQKSDQERVLTAGYQAHIAKPIDIEQIITAITQLLG